MSKYVLICETNDNTTPIKYSDNIDELRAELNKIYNETLYKCELDNDVLRIDDLDMTYKIIETENMFK